MQSVHWNWFFFVSGRWGVGLSGESCSEKCCIAGKEFSGCGVGFCVGVEDRGYVVGDSAGLKD